MPDFDDATATSAPIEDVWKLVNDPGSYPAWWAGVGSVEPGSDGFTLFPTGYPDFPMPQDLRSDSDGRRVTISCLVSDLEFTWRLEPTPGDGTRIAVHVRLPEEERHRLPSQRAAMRASLRALASLAAGATDVLPARG